MPGRVSAEAASERVRTTLVDPALRRSLMGVEQALLFNDASTRQLSALLRVSAPPYFTVRDMVDRWPLSREAVLGLLKERGYHNGRRGQSPRLTLDQFLALDPVAREMGNGQV